MSRIHPAATSSFTIIHEAATTSIVPGIVRVEDEETHDTGKSNASTQTDAGTTTCTSEHELLCKYVDSLIARGEDVPDEFICPITTFSMRDPVNAVDGFTYERSAITKWLQRASVSPMTREDMGGQVTKSGEVVGNHPLYFNMALRNSLQRWAREHAKSQRDTSLQNALLRV